MMNNSINGASSFLRSQTWDDGLTRGFRDLQRSRPVIAVQTAVLCSLALVALAGNVLVIVVIYRSRRVQSTTNYFVTSLALSDTALVLLSTPFVCARMIAQEWLAGDVACRLARFIQFFAMSSTSFVMVAICVDRFYTVIQPLSFKVTRGTAKRLILSSWGASITLAGICLYFFTLREVETADGNSRAFCPTFIPANQWSGELYGLGCVLAQFILPVVLLSAMYTRIAYHIRSVRSQVQRHRERSSTPVPRAKVKMVKMLMILSVITLLSYLPFYVTQTFHCLSYGTFLSDDVFIASFWLITFSAASKPIVYACQNGNFWRGCKEVLCMSTMRCYRLNTYIVTSASSISKRNHIGVMDLAKDQRSFSVDSPVGSRHKSIEAPPWLNSGSFPATCL